MTFSDISDERSDDFDFRNFRNLVAEKKSAFLREKLSFFDIIIFKVLKNFDVILAYLEYFWLQSSPRYEN